MRWPVAVAVVTAVGTWVGIGVSPALRSDSSPGQGTRIYWDQNEEEDWLVHPGLQQPTPLIPAWDANGQMCIFRDGTGRFTTGYNPTTDPSNPGFGKPMKQPPVGEAVWDVHGNFTGQTIFVPGPYQGGDIPPDQGTSHFNNNGTFTGCVFDSHGNLFATDLGNSQGNVPPSDSGRLIKWFRATNYTSYCIVAGPTAGGTEPHHVDGTGGLRQPGTLARDAHDNILVPVLGVGAKLNGEVLEFVGSSLPTNADQCPNSNENMPVAPVQSSVLINTTANTQATPQGIARDPVCRCWAVSSVLVGNAVAWYHDDGTPLARPPVPPIPPPPIPPPPIPAGSTASGYTPYGLAFTPDGTLYFADIHITCLAPPTEGDPTSAVGCGPANNQGQVMKVTFSGLGSVPSVPAAVNTKPLNFPVGVTACTPSETRVCPAPPGQPTGGGGGESGQHGHEWVNDDDAEL
jgi:hypothetical protein